MSFCLSDAIEELDTSKINPPCRSDRMKSVRDAMSAVESAKSAERKAIADMVADMSTDELLAIVPRAAIVKLCR